MAIVGRKPNMLRELTGKTTQATVPQGNVRVAPLRVAPKPPKWMTNKFALANWEEVAPVMVENRLLTRSNLPLFELMVASYGKIVENYTTRSGTVNTGLLTLYRSIVNDFGLTPCSQIRAHVPDKAEDENPFLTNRKAA